MSPTPTTTTTTTTTTTSTTPQQQGLDADAKALLKVICKVSKELEGYALQFKKNLIKNHFITKYCDWHAVIENRDLMGNICFLFLKLVLTFFYRLH